MFGLIIFLMGFLFGWFGQKYKNRIFRLGAKLEKTIEKKLDEIENS